MKRIFTFAFLFTIILFAVSTQAQITNLKVNGQSGSFVATQDVGVVWECDIPIGQSAEFEIWLHVGGGTFIDPSTDKNIFGTGTQTDGDVSGNNGPPDMDAAVNGRLTFSTNTIYLAPGSYTFKFKNSGVTTSISGTILPASAPAYTIAGKFTPGSGKGAKNILVRATVKNSNMMQSFGLTDASGNYVINIGSYAAGLTEKVSIQDNIEPYAALPQDTSVIMSQSWAGINFTAVNTDAKLVGYLKTESGAGIASTPVRCYARDNGDTKKEVYTDENGMYSFGFTTAELAANPIWQLEVNSQLAPAYVNPVSGSISLHSGDSLRVDLLAYTANSTITGKVYLDGKIPSGKNYTVVAQINDTAATWSQSNSSTGEFTIYVTDKLTNYTVSVWDLDEQYAADWNSINQWAAGATEIRLDVVTVAWSQQTSNTNNNLNQVVFPTSSIGYAVGNSGTILKTTNAGTSWNILSSGSTEDLRAVSFINEKTGWVGGTNGAIKKTTDGGASWVAENSGISYPINILQFTDANNGWAMDMDNFLRTTNGGATWAPVSLGILEATLSFHMLNSSTGYLCTNCNNIYKTTNGGTSWSLVGSTQGFYYTKIRFANELKGFILFYENSLGITTDGGVTWTTKQLDPSSCLTDIFVVDANTVYLVGKYNMIYKSSDGGMNWKQQFLNFKDNDSFNSVYFPDSQNGWAVGENGVIRHTASGGTVDVRDVAAGKAGTFVLSQNYPNPFNPATVIDYVVPQNAGATEHVSLKIFNMLGQEVAVLVNKDLGSGSYKASFNGAGLASGIYLYTLQVGGQGITKKMILMK